MLPKVKTEICHPFLSADFLPYDSIKNRPYFRSAEIRKSSQCFEKTTCVIFDILRSLLSTMALANGAKAVILLSQLEKPLKYTNSIRISPCGRT
jgi:hypothetical protein